MIGLTNSFGNIVMNSRPVTLGDWYAILKIDDYVEAATYLNKQKTPPAWLSTYLLQWAPEVIVQRDLTSANVSREYIMDKLASVEAAAAQLTDLLEDRAVMKFLQMPPHEPFQSELGTKMFVSQILVRAHDAATSPILVRGNGKGNSGTGRAVTSDELSPEQICAAIVGEAWYALHGSFPIAFTDAANAATAYWTATGGTSERSFGSNQVGRWIDYFRKLRDEEFFWGKRKEMKRQLLSWMQE
jgi:hypothetical protein